VKHPEPAGSLSRFGHFWSSPGILVCTFLTSLLRILHTYTQPVAAPVTQSICCPLMLAPTLLCFHGCGTFNPFYLFSSLGERAHQNCASCSWGCANPQSLKVFILNTVKDCTLYHSYQHLLTRSVSATSVNLLVFPTEYRLYVCICSYIYIAYHCIRTNLTHVSLPTHVLLLVIPC